MEKQIQATNLGEIEYSIRVGNPLIVFLNGFGSFDTEQAFSKVIASLPKSYGIIAPDYLNSGFSGKSVKPYTIQDEAQKIAEIVNEQETKQVIVVAHSIGGVYAFHLQNAIKNLKAIIAIEPTTREIILNPPKEEEYVAHEKNDGGVEFIKNKIHQFFESDFARLFWQTTENNSEKFDEKANKNAAAAMENDAFWISRDQFSSEIPIVIVTEAYRKQEYLRSEYFNKNSASKVVSLGSFHYIHWEEAERIAELIKEHAVK